MLACDLVVDFSFRAFDPSLFCKLNLSLSARKRIQAIDIFLAQACFAYYLFFVFVISKTETIRQVQPGAYVCCGRVAVEFNGQRGTPLWQPAKAQQPKHSRPLRFSLRLLDCDAMLAPDSSTSGEANENDDDGDDEVTSFAGILRAASN